MFHLFNDVTEKVGETGISCNTGKLLQLRFLKNWKGAQFVSYFEWEKKKSNKLCMGNLEMIDGNTNYE